MQVLFFVLFQVEQQMIESLSVYGGRFIFELTKFTTSIHNIVVVCLGLCYFALLDFLNYSPWSLSWHQVFCWNSIENIFPGIKKLSDLFYNCWLRYNIYGG